MKTKAAPKKSSEPCTSTAGDGELKCALVARDALGRDHTVHTTSKAGRDAAQHTTWQTAADGRIKVTEYARGKKKAEWFEGDQTELCLKCGGVQCEPDACLYDLRPQVPAVVAEVKAPSKPKGNKIYTAAEREALAKKQDAPVSTPSLPLTRIGDHEVHPAAALFRLMRGADYAAFAEDIRANGQRKPIVRIRGLILDGRNRLSVCLDLGLEPKFREFGDDSTDGTDPIAFVVSENVARRHLDETERTWLGAELVPMYEAQARERMLSGKSADPTANVRQGSAAEHAAQAVNVSPRSIENAIRVQRDAAPEVIAASKDRGQLKVSAAAELATLPKQKQREIIEKMGTGEMRAGRVRAHVKQEKKRDVVRKINEQQVAPVPIGPFRVVVVDWPWPYENSDQHEGSRGHIPYPPMSIDEAFAMAPELDKLAHEDGCILGFWTTNAFMPDAVRIVEAWGFSWRTIRTWDKGRDGIGTWCRSRTEHLIIAERGDVEHTLNEVSTLICEARREHSRKPDEPMEAFAKHCPGPHLEMFSREPRKGWASWGAEPKKFAGAA